jgi:hypothetical protein
MEGPWLVVFGVSFLVFRVWWLGIGMPEKSRVHGSPFRALQPRRNLEASQLPGLMAFRFLPTLPQPPSGCTALVDFEHRFPYGSAITGETVCDNHAPG